MILGRGVMNLFLERAIKTIEAVKPKLKEDLHANLGLLSSHKSIKPHQLHVHTMALRKTTAEIQEVVKQTGATPPIHKSDGTIANL